MKGVPILATLVVAAAVAAMVALGFWQLGRAEWKAELIESYRAAEHLPTVDLDPLLERTRAAPGGLEALGFRRARVTCRAVDQQPMVRAGRNREDRPGQSYLVPCRPGAPGLAGRLMVNAGWSLQPGIVRRITIDGEVEGRLGSVADEGQVVLTADAAQAPLVPSRAPAIEAIPNNHLSYAVQWFLFAAAAAGVYVVALVARRRERA